MFEANAVKTVLQDQPLICVEIAWNSNAEILEFIVIAEYITANALENRLEELADECLYPEVVCLVEVDIWILIDLNQAKVICLKDVDVVLGQFIPAFTKATECCLDHKLKLFDELNI